MTYVSIRARSGRTQRGTWLVGFHNKIWLDAKGGKQSEPTGASAGGLEIKSAAYLDVESGDVSSHCFSVFIYRCCPRHFSSVRPMADFEKRDQFCVALYFMPPRVWGKPISIFLCKNRGTSPIVHGTLLLPDRKADGTGIAALSPHCLFIQSGF